MAFLRRKVKLIETCTFPGLGRPLMGEALPLKRELRLGNKLRPGENGSHEGSGSSWNQKSLVLAEMNSVYSLGDAAVPWMVLSTLFWGHLEKDKRKRHQKVVSGAASSCSGFLPTDDGTTSCPGPNKSELRRLRWAV